jgi:GWxTD domain-containing protein
MPITEMRKRAVAIGLLAWTVAGSLVAQGLHVQGRPMFQNRPSADSICIVAFPFAVNRDDLDFRPDSGVAGLLARIFAELVVSDTSAQIVSRLNTYFTVRVADSSEAQVKGIKVFNRLVAGLKPGEYMATLTVLDAASKREEVLRFDTISVPAPAQGLTLGGAVLAYRISYVGDSIDPQWARMVDNGYLVFPNPLGVYGLYDSVLYLYAEIYGLQFDSTVSRRHRLAYSILNPAGEIVKDYGYQIKPTIGLSQVVAQSLDMRDLGRGGFWLRVALEDLADSAVDTIKLPFWHIASEADLHPPATAFDSLTMGERVSAMHYLLTPPERATIDALPTEGKVNFLTQYWKEHDSSKTAGGVVSQSQLVEWFRFANSSFSTNASISDGWTTDRGRIYMSYGPPEDRIIEPHPFEGSAYEIWHYRTIKRGYYFVFIELSSSADLKLVHSNAPGERYDQAWEDYFSTVLFRYR